MLVTRFMTPDGVGELHDFMPIAGKHVTDRHRIVRRLRVVRGTMQFVVDLQPGFDYARAKHTVQRDRGRRDLHPGGAGGQVAGPHAARRRLEPRARSRSRASR